MVILSYLSHGYKRFLSDSVQAVGALDDLESQDYLGLPGCGGGICVRAGMATAAGTLLKAGELARRTGITRQALHIYVQMGLLRPVLSSHGGHRLYDDRSVERVALIRKLCASGYSLKDIREIFIKDR